jgi:hypothetical protein
LHFLTCVCRQRAVAAEDGRDTPYWLAKNTDSVSAENTKRATTTFKTVVTVEPYLAHDLHVGDGVRPLRTRDEQEGVAPARLELPQAGLGVSGLLLKR